MRPVFWLVITFMASGKKLD